MSEIPVLVMTSDRYLDALRGFAHLFNKYWSPDQGVIVAGFTAPAFTLPANFGFYRIGRFEDYPVSRWSDALIDVLINHPNLETFVLMLEDYWLVRPVDVAAVAMLYHYARQFRYVLKIDLCADRLYAAGMSDYDNCGRLDLIRSDPQSQYHMSLMTGIWNRERMLEFLIPGETPWQVEIDGTPRVRAAQDRVLVLGTRQWPVRHTLALRSGNPSALNLDGLKPGDLSDLAKAGCLDAWETQTGV